MREILISLIGVLFFQILTTVFVSFSLSESFASNGNVACKLYKPLTVAINAKFADNSTRNGFGFIVGEQNTSQGSFFYIVTANHVVRKEAPESHNPEISLRFFWDIDSSVKKVKRLDIYDEIFDLALLRIPTKKIFGPEQFSWIGQSWCQQWQREETVWFIGQAQKWYVPPDKWSGSLFGTRPDPHGFIRIEINSVQPGTSGAPLITNKGIVGMVLRDTGKSVQAVSIASIRRFVLDHRYPWNLAECGTSTYPPDVISVDNGGDTDRNIAIESHVRPTHSSPETKAPRPALIPDRVMTEKTHQPSSAVEQLRPADINLAVLLRERESKKASTDWHFDNKAKMIFEPLTKMHFIRIPGGCFQMGARENDKERRNNEGPLHKVCVDSFFIGQYEVTQDQWFKVMKKNPARFQQGNTDSYPVEHVSWKDIQKFIRKLNKKSGGLNFRLPTEAEWEYAARAGTSTSRYWGNDISCDKAMYENSLSSKGRCIDYVQQRGLTASSTAPVGSYPPNQFGLYDMLGNVYEWCADWYSDEYAPSSQEKNPTGPASGKLRVIRGGNWLSGAQNVRSASRYWYAPHKACPILGFRLVLSAK